MENVCVTFFFFLWTLHFFADINFVLFLQWQTGDFILSDNLALGHEATPETQLPVSEVGLRVLHRTTIQGTNFPSK